MNLLQRQLKRLVPLFSKNKKLLINTNISSKVQIHIVNNINEINK